MTALSLDEGVTHTAADDEVVNLSDEVLQNSKFGTYLGAADDCGEGTLGVLQNVVNSLYLTFHQVAEHLVIGEVLCDERG